VVSSIRLPLEICEKLFQPRIPDIYFAVVSLKQSCQPLITHHMSSPSVSYRRIDPGLNRSRALLLRHYGFDVTTSESKEHAREQVERSHFDVLIFGNTLPSDTCWELAKIFRHHNSKGTIIEIIPSPWAAPKNQPDASVVGTAEPEQLITTIRRTLPDVT
jgi:hypothetical protein